MFLTTINCSVTSGATSPTVVVNTSQTLEEMAADPSSIKCCWTGGLNLHKKLTGFVRVITYEGTTPISIYEGMMKNGLRQGFGRLITGKTGAAQIGYFY